jgi:hypothetical protein
MRRFTYFKVSVHSQQKPLLLCGEQNQLNRMKTMFTSPTSILNFVAVPAIICFLCAKQIEQMKKVLYSISQNETTD